jgi:Beta-lactamase class C and other penicillin binding proteins
MQNSIEKRINHAIQEKVFPGCVVGLIKPDGNRSVMPFGRHTYDSGSPAMTDDSIFDVASITKAVPTSSLALTLIDEGRLRLDDKLIDFVPEFRNSFRQSVLIRHLLTQTLDFGFRLSAFKDRKPEELLEAVFTTEFKARPGTTFFYSNATSILLGLVVERAFGKDLATLGEKIFFGPLNMSRTTFFPDRFNRDEIVPTEIDAWRGRMVQAEVHDESAFVLRQKMIAGSAGLFSTVPDILNFIDMLLHDGTYGGRRFFSPAIMDMMQTNQIAVPGAATGLGWELGQRRYMGRCCSEQTIGKTGFTGCVCMCDRSKHRGLVLLSNYTFPARKIDMAAINSVRSDIADIVFSDD